MAKTMEELGNDYRESYEKTYNTMINSEINEFEEILKISSLLHEKYIEITGTSTHQWYFITIRPDPKKINFEDFYKVVLKYVERKCIKDYYLSFEQKGINEENLGEGFHVHIIADATWRSKKECLRDTQSTFNKCTAANCVDVQPTREPEKIKNDYLLEYKSDDNHKECTKEWDKVWREKLNLLDLYHSNLLERKLSPIKSGTGTTIEFL